MSHIGNDGNMEAPRKFERLKVIYMVRESYGRLDERCIARIVKNLDRQAELRGAALPEIEDDDVIVPAVLVDLLVEVTIDLSTRTMRFTFASKLAYDVIYSFKELDKAAVLRLLMSCHLLHFGTEDAIKEQLNKGGFTKELIYSDREDHVYSRRYAIRR